MLNRSPSTLFILRFSFTIYFFLALCDEIYTPDDNISVLHFSGTSPPSAVAMIFYSRTFFLAPALELVERTESIFKIMINMRPHSLLHKTPGVRRRRTPATIELTHTNIVSAKTTHRNN